MANKKEVSLTWDEMFKNKYGEAKYKKLDLHTRRIGEVVYDSVLDGNNNLKDIIAVNNLALVNTCVETETAELRQEQLLKNILLKLNVSENEIASVLAKGEK